ncbi:unnamed protein product [Brassica oleracea var. botrytis]
MNKCILTARNGSPVVTESSREAIFVPPETKVCLVMSSDYSKSVRGGS